jgi:hypothetical protein
MADRYQRWNDWAPRYIADLCHDFGLTPEQAAAFPGNFAAESGHFNLLQEQHPLVSGSKGGYGHGQWTGPRRRTFEAWLKAKGYKADSYEGNYSFVFRELSGPYRQSVLERVKRSTSLENAVWIVGKYYEGPAVLNLAPRVKGAKEALALYKAHPVQHTVWPSDKPHEESVVAAAPATIPATTTVAANTARPAIPWFKSLVFTGASGGLGASLFAIFSAYRPGVPFLNQIDTLAPPVVAAVSTAVALIGRVTSTAQPLTTSQEAADKHAEAQAVASSGTVPDEAWSGTLADTPGAATGPLPLTQLSLDQLSHEMPELAEKVAGLVSAVVPMVGLLAKLSETDVRKTTRGRGYV